MPLLFKLFDLPALNSHRQDVFEVFDQTFNSPLNDPSLPVYAMKRDLTKVFEHSRCQESGFSFQNSVMIDSDLKKVKDYPLNSIVIHEYTEAEVRSPNEHQSRILLDVRDYLF